MLFATLLKITPNIPTSIPNDFLGLSIYTAFSQNPYLKLCAHSWPWAIVAIFLLGLNAWFILSLLRLNQSLKKSQSVLSESQQQLSDIIEFLPDATFAIDLHGVAIAWNRATERLTGVNKKDVLNKGNFEYALPFYGERRPVLANLVLRSQKDISRLYPSLRKENDVYTTTAYLPDILGKKIFVLITAAVLKNSTGDIVGAIETVRDITESQLAEQKLKEAYEHLKQAQLQFVQSEKMTAVGRLAAGVAHEINNPLAFIFTNLGILQESCHHVTALLAAYEDLRIATEKNNKEGQNKALVNIREITTNTDRPNLLADLPNLISESMEGVDRVKGIVTDLQDFANPARESYAITAINAELDKALLITNQELSRTCSVVKEYLQPSPLIMANANQISLVFVNLLINAAQSFKDKGVITLHTTSTQGRAIVEIQDNGQGIPAKHLNNIFDPFFTTKNIGQGAGLGLYVVYNIIKDLRGTISVDSTVGQGTRFLISLPLLEIRK